MDTKVFWILGNIGIGTLWVIQGSLDVYLGGLKFPYGGVVATVFFVLAVIGIFDEALEKKRDDEKL